MKQILAWALLFSNMAFADDAESAQKLYESQQWVQAARQYGKLTQAEPKNALYWYRLGNAARHAGDLAEAEPAFQKALDLGFQPMLARVGLAAVYSENGTPEKALTILEALAKKGTPAATLIEGDAAFKPISSEPRFIAAIESMKEQAAPCKYHQKYPKYREFDFWIGNWDVYGKGGALTGHNKVDLIVGDCVISENWTDAAGSVGKSYSKYNPFLKRWEQYWVDQYGSSTHYIGNLEGANMVFLADGFDPSGKPQKQRMTFYPLSPDKVRQFGENSADGGKTWTTSFDLTYVRHHASNASAGN